MLLPAPGKAKAAAQSIKCVNNLKQISLATAMYAGDYNDRMMPLMDLGDNNSIVYWEEKLIGYNYVPGASFQCPVLSTGGWDKVDASWAFTANPNFRWPFYGMNEALGGDYQMPWVVRKSASSFRSPSSTIMMTDVRATDAKTSEAGWFSVLHFYTETAGFGLVDTRHNGAAGTAFLDGHVTSIKSGRTADFSAYSPTNNPYTGAFQAEIDGYWPEEGTLWGP